MEFINQIKDNVSNSLSTIYSKEDVLAMLEKIQSHVNTELKSQYAEELIEEFCSIAEDNIYDLITVNTSIDFNIVKNTIDASVEIEEIIIDTDDLKELLTNTMPH